MSALSLPAVKHIHSPDDVISFELPNVPQIREYWKQMVKDAKSEYFRLIVAPPYRPISTGKRSLMNRIHGHIQWIMIFATHDSGQVFDIDDWKYYFKVSATPYGYPCTFMEDSEGNTIKRPWSLKRASMEQGNILSEYITRWAAEHGIQLPEYDEAGNLILV
jgi:hypothetical protein